MWNDDVAIISPTTIIIKLVSIYMHETQTYVFVIKVNLLIAQIEIIFMRTR